MVRWGKAWGVGLSIPDVEFVLVRRSSENKSKLSTNRFSRQHVFLIRPKQDGDCSASNYVTV